LTSIVIGNSVTNILDYSFASCSILTSITIPSSVVNIHYTAFNDNPLLTQLVLRSSSIIIANVFQDVFTDISFDFNGELLYNFGAIQNKCNGRIQLKNVTIGNQITTIGNSAFINCSNLTSVTFSQTSQVNYIGQMAFKNCTSLSIFNIPPAIVGLGSNIFLNVPLIDLTLSAPLNVSDTGVISLKRVTYDYAGKIPDYACDGLINLTSIIIGNTITEIGSNAFRNCSNVIQLIIPQSINIIHTTPFEGMDRLETIELESQINPASLLTINSLKNIIFDYEGSLPDNVCQNKTNLQSITLSDKITSVGNNSFQNCTLLNSVIFTGQISISILGDYCFDNCSSLSVINIPSSVKIIGSYAFSNCTNFTSIDIPDSVTQISSGIVSGCSKLTAIIFPNNITNIPNNMFNGCIELSEIIIPSSITNIGDDAFNNCSILNTCTFEYINNDTNSVTNIGKRAFKNCVLLPSIIIPSNVTNIDEEAFSNCTIFNSIIFESPTTLTSIGKESFQNTILSSINIPESVSYIGEGAFKSTNITSIDIPDTVTIIQPSILKNCGFLTSITIGQYVTRINNSAFYDCSNITTFVIPDSVKYIYTQAFYNCSKITSIVIPSQIIIISDDVFDNCTSVTDIILNSDVPFNNLFNALTSIKNVSFNYNGRIHSNACKNMTSLTNITIGNSIGDIEANAFDGCSGITNITIPSNIVTIANTAFDNMTNLINVVIETNRVNIKNIMTTNINLNNITFDYNGAIPNYECDGRVNLSTITIGENITEIGDYAFNDCSSLTTSNINNSIISSIGNSAFKNTRLTSFFMPSNITSIGTNIFQDTPITQITWESPNSIINVLSDISNIITDITINFSGVILENTFEGLTQLTSITIGEQITGIGTRAFAGCNSLINVIINDGVTNIGNEAFIDCNQITLITIPTTVLSIGNSAFSGCGNIQTITLPNSITSIGTNCFNNCLKLNSITLPNNISKIDSYTFNNCDLLKTITIPDSVRQIGNYAFNDCSGLTSIIIPNWVNTIGNFGFYKCSNLNSLTFSSRLITIGDNAFNFCSKLTSITIPDSVKYIKNATFASCSLLTDIIFSANSQLITIGDRAFEADHVLNDITLPGTLKSLGEYCFFECHKFTSLVIPNSVTSIGNGMFWNNQGIKIVTLPNTIKYIPDNFFIYAIKLTSIIIPQSVTSIGKSAFQSCAALTSIIIPNNVTTIVTEAFRNCSVMTSVTFSSTSQLTSIGDWVFGGCNAVTSFIIPNSVTSIGTYAFTGCSDATSITLPNLNRLNQGIFASCPSLTSIIIPSTVKSIGGGAFKGCVGLSEIVLSSIDKIENLTFAYCSSLTSIIIPNSAASIGDYAFHQCSILTSITIGTNIMTIGTNAFSKCLQLPYVILPQKLTSIGTDIFKDCSVLTTIIISPTNNLGITSSPNTVNSTAFGKTVKVEPNIVIINGNIATFYGFGEILDGTSRINSATSVEINGPTSIGENAFNNAINLTTINIRNGLQVIKNNAFKKSNLTSCNIPISVTNLGSNLFEECTNLTSFTFSATSRVQSIGDNTFMNCSSLKSIIIPRSVTILGESSFHNCQLLTNVTFLHSIISPAQLTTIGANAFKSCIKLTGFVIPNLTTHIGDGAFEMCSELYTIIIPKFVTYLGNTSFKQCSELNTVTIKSNSRLQTTGTYVFDGCLKLEYFTFGTSSQLRTISEGFLNNCEILKTVVIPDYLTTISDKSFNGCKTLKQIIMPNTNRITNIGANAFSNCDALSKVYITYTLGLTLGITSPSGPTLLGAPDAFRPKIDSSNTTVGGEIVDDALTTKYTPGGGFMWNTSGVSFQINLLRSLSIPIYSTENPPVGSVEYWNGDRPVPMPNGNWVDPEYYALKIDANGNLPVYTYGSEVGDFEDGLVQWTITGWGQTVLRGTIDTTTQGKTILVVKNQEYRQFSSALNVNPQESFTGTMYTDVVSYTFDGAVEDFTTGKVLTVTTSPTAPNNPVGLQEEFYGSAVTTYSSEPSPSGGGANADGYVSGSKGTLYDSNDLNTPIETFITDDLGKYIMWTPIEELPDVFTVIFEGGIDVNTGAIQTQVMKGMGTKQESISLGSIVLNVTPLTSILTEIVNSSITSGQPINASNLTDSTNVLSSVFGIDSAKIGGDFIQNSDSGVTKLVQTIATSTSTLVSAIGDSSITSESITSSLAKTIISTGNSSQTLDLANTANIGNIIDQVKTDNVSVSIPDNIKENTTSYLTAVNDTIKNIVINPNVNAEEGFADMFSKITQISTAASTKSKNTTFTEVVTVPTEQEINNVVVEPTVIFKQSDLNVPIYSIVWGTAPKLIPRISSSIGNYEYSIDDPVDDVVTFDNNGNMRLNKLGTTKSSVLQFGDDNYLSKKVNTEVTVIKNDANHQAIIGSSSDLDYFLNTDNAIYGIIDSDIRITKQQTEQLSKKRITSSKRIVINKLN